MSKRKALRMKYEGDLLHNGKKSVRTKTFQGIVPETDVDALKKVVEAFDSLTKKKATAAEVVEVMDLI